MKRWKIRFWVEDGGATAVEYALIAAAMGLALVVAMPLLAGSVNTSFSSLGSHVASGK